MLSISRMARISILVSCSRAVLLEAVNRMHWLPLIHDKSWRRVAHKADSNQVWTVFASSQLEREKKMLDPNSSCLQLVNHKRRKTSPVAFHLLPESTTKSKVWSIEHQLARESTITAVSKGKISSSWIIVAARRCSTVVWISKITSLPFRWDRTKVIRNCWRVLQTARKWMALLQEPIMARVGTMVQLVVPDKRVWMISMPLHIDTIPWHLVLT